MSVLFISASSRLLALHYLSSDSTTTSFHPQSELLSLFLIINFFFTFLLLLTFSPTPGLLAQPVTLECGIEGEKKEGEEHSFMIAKRRYPSVVRQDVRM